MAFLTVFPDFSLITKPGFIYCSREALSKLIPFMARQDHSELNQQFTVRHEPVEGLNQRSKRFFID